MINKYKFVEIEVKVYSINTKIQNLDTKDVYSVKLPATLFYKDEVLDIEEACENNIEEIIFECNSPKYKDLKKSICIALRDFLYIS